MNSCINTLVCQKTFPLATFVWIRAYNAPKFWHICPVFAHLVALPNSLYVSRLGYSSQGNISQDSPIPVFGMFSPPSHMTFAESNFCMVQCLPIASDHLFYNTHFTAYLSMFLACLLRRASTTSLTCRLCRPQTVPVEHGCLPRNT